MNEFSGLVDTKIDQKLKLAALWTSIMFCYIYGDFFSLFVPGRIQALSNGQSGIGETTPTALFAFAILMVVPSLMIFLSVAARAAISRLLNIVFGGFYALVVILVGSLSLSRWMIFYVFLAAVEALLSIGVVCLAVRWPRQEAESNE
jgi:hypothetical protein